MWKKKKREQVVGFNAEKLFLAAAQPLSMLYSYCHTAPGGLHVSEVEHGRDRCSKNKMETRKEKESGFGLHTDFFINPFIGVLTGLLIISFVLDIALGPSRASGWITICCHLHHGGVQRHSPLLLFRSGKPAHRAAHC